VTTSPVELPDAIPDARLARDLESRVTTKTLNIALDSGRTFGLPGMTFVQTTRQGSL
jgi:hypothetical protein